jgi:hypothetical protein
MDPVLMTAMMAMKRSPSIWGMNVRPGVVIRESWPNNFKRQISWNNLK